MPFSFGRTQAVILVRGLGDYAADENRKKTHSPISANLLAIQGGKH